MPKDRITISLSPRFRFAIKPAKQMIEALELKELAMSIWITGAISEDMRLGKSAKELIDIYGIENFQWVLAASVVDACLEGSAIRDWAESIVKDIPRKELTQYVLISEPLKKRLPTLVTEYFKIVAQIIEEEENVK